MGSQPSADTLVSSRSLEFKKKIVFIKSKINEILSFAPVEISLETSIRAKTADLVAGDKKIA